MPITPACGLRENFGVFIKPEFTQNTYRRLNKAYAQLSYLTGS